MGTTETSAQRLSRHKCRPAVNTSTKRGRRMPREPKKIDKTPTTRIKRTRRTKDTSQAVSDLEISRLAYEIYEARGRTDGSQLDDWLQAEQQLSSRSD